MTHIDHHTRALLIEYAARYETPDFINGDPSWFMHQVEGEANQEATAFVASCLSYGSRQQFMKKIEWMMERAQGRMDQWVLSGSFAHDLPADSTQCFYRLYTVGEMHRLLHIYRQMMGEHGTMGHYLRNNSTDALRAAQAVCQFFHERGGTAAVPKDTQSACKRVCMFLRWMVRSGSPVDLGLWADFLDRRSLIMPLDTHVLSEACTLGLMASRTATMSAARRLTDALAEVFPDDPLKGDFALFGYGVASPHKLHSESCG